LNHEKHEKHEKPERYSQPSTSSRAKAAKRPKTRDPAAPYGKAGGALMPELLGPGQPLRGFRDDGKGRGQFSFVLFVFFVVPILPT
jgi:hypothetical protein